jgi:hypothetical protein
MRRLVEVEPLIDLVMPLENGIAAFERAQAPGIMKVLLRPGH